MGDGFLLINIIYYVGMIMVTMALSNERGGDWSK